MKLNRKKGKGLKVVSIDGNRKNSLHSSLLKHSEQKRRQELDTRGNAAPSNKPSTKVTIKTNRAGNLRGMKSELDPERAKKLRAMRKFYNKQMPVPQCNGCAYAQNCPQFKAGYECSFLPFLNSHEIDSSEDLIAYMKELLGANIRRAHMSMIMETLGGGKPDIELSEQLALLFGQLKELKLLEDRNTTEVTLESDDMSIVGKLFGNLDNLLNDTEEAVSKPVEVPALEYRHADTDEAIKKKGGINEEVMDDFVNIGLADEAKKSKKVLPSITPAKLNKKAA